MKLDDADAVLREAPSIIRASPEVDRNAQVKYKNKNTNTRINGTGQDYPVISNHDVQEGRYFNQSEVKSLKRVAVIGSGPAKELFDRESPVGKTVRINGINFKVIGRLKEKGGTGWRNPDDAFFVPVTTAMRRLFGMENVSRVVMQARNEAVMLRAQDEIDQVLRRRHKIPSSGDADFRIFNQADIAEAQDEQQGIFSKLITYLAVVSLLVGGIGIMNIMLVSVTERTREIGVRKAIGAKRRDILAQFLLEALFLSLVGGLLGVTFGVVGSTLVGSMNDWKVVIAPETTFMAFSFSALVGVFFGFYPALKASKLNPIEALRYE
jgi:putative ABC transport system permease protein